MQQAQDFVEKFIKPWLEKHHPHADLVVMAGSFGRAMKNGSYQPIASSDVDLVIVYKDLEKGGFKAATQIFTMEDVGTVMEEGKPRIMMVDTNIHDFASLHYHDQIVRENKSVAFINVMLDEGYVLKDTQGIGPVIQQKAKEFLAEGPLPTTKAGWQSEISTLQTFLKDIHEAKSAEEKRFLGAMALIHVCDFGLHLQGRWPRFNQAYRVFDQDFPQEGQKISDAFSDLIRNGDSTKAEVLLADYIKQGGKKAKAAPDSRTDVLFSVKDNVPADEVRAVSKMFSKFALEHYCEALETSQRRGELAHLSNLSATLMMLKGAQEANDGVAPTTGKAAMHFFNDRLPDTLPVVLQGVDDKQFDGLRRVAEHALSDMGGLHYSRLENYYLDDVARVNAMIKKQANDNRPVKAPSFKPKYNP